MSGGWTPDGQLGQALVARPGDPHEAEREQLRAGLRAMRDRAKQLAANIDRDLPELTVHGVDHLDALWPRAAQIAGPDIHLNPIEAFLFGAAVLVHDLGLAVAAYPDVDALHTGAPWRDALGQELRATLGRAASRAEIDEASPEIRKRAEQRLLRSNHARRAENLALAWWPNGDDRLYLLSDEKLRGDFGALAGAIAASHWWPAEKLPERLQWAHGAPGGWPGDWSSRPVLIACLLRCADAAHLDATRAPAWTQIGRTLGPTAQAHWDFQSKLAQPELTDTNRLLFTTPNPFPPVQAAAWWTCFDALCVVDRELRAADALLDGSPNRPRIAARGVVGVEDPVRLADHVRPSGWKPLDARLKVSEIGRLVRTLGGRQLYGDTPYVPLRELIQNASDAIRARQALGTQGGHVTVRHSPPGDSPWLEVEDDGLGMSAAVMADALLDFGRSGWDSPTIADEYPGLIGSGFQPTGRFGIGFFSVFMWAEHVEVTSRPQSGGEDDTTVLAFERGLGFRPLLRDPIDGERLGGGGTRVRLRLRKSLLEDQRLRDDEAVEDPDHLDLLAELCEFLCPALPVELRVEIGDRSLVVIEANDWLTLDDEDLFDRIVRPNRLERWYEETPVEDLPERTELIEDTDGTPIARGALVDPIYAAYDDGQAPPPGVLVHGGLRVRSLSEVSGVWLTLAPNATRDRGRLMATRDQLRVWAISQAQKILVDAEDSQGLLAGALTDVLLSLGADNADLAVTGCIPSDDIADFAANHSEILLLDRKDAALMSEPPAGGPVARLDPALPEMLDVHPLTHRPEFRFEPSAADPRPAAQRSFERAICDEVAAAWGLPDADALELETVTLTVGKCGDTDIEANAIRLTRPDRT